VAERFSWIEYFIVGRAGKGKKGAGREGLRAVFGRNRRKNIHHHRNENNSRKAIIAIKWVPPWVPFAKKGIARYP